MNCLLSRQLVQYKRTPRPYHVKQQMKLSALILGALSITGAISALIDESFDSSDNPAVCERELEGIVYQPHSAALAYLNKISEEIKVVGPILWTPQGDSYLQAFENKYQVGVQVYDAFMNIVYNNLGGLEMKYMSTTATANMNGSGYARDTDGDELVRYEFIVYDQIGQLKYVLINMPLSEAPAFKN